LAAFMLHALSILSSLTWSFEFSLGKSTSYEAPHYAVFSNLPSLFSPNILLGITSRLTSVLASKFLSFSLRYLCYLTVGSHHQHKTVADVYHLISVPPVFLGLPNGVF
jgi:hypothetical protein